MTDKLKFRKTDWGLVLLLVIVNAKFSCFHLNIQKFNFWFQENSPSDVIVFYVVFNFHQQIEVTR